MSEFTADTAENAEKAYAEAAAEVRPAREIAEEASTAPASKPVKSAAANEIAEPKKPARTASRKSQKPVSRPVARTASVTARRAPRAVGAAAATASAKAGKPKPTVTELKEKIMATAKTNDFANPIADVVGEFQARTKAAYEKSAEVATEVTELAKGNVEAFVESSKIFAAGAQSLGKTYAEEARTAYETATADVKELAAVKSPTELFQLQGKIMRRNFDTLVAAGSKNTEAVMKLASEAFAPISGRVNVAAEKLARVA